MLLLMCIGLLLGPLLGIVPPDFLGEAGNTIVMLILVMILFEGATKLRLQYLQKAILGTLSLTLISFLLTTLGVGFLLWKFLPLDAVLSFLIGAIIGGNATAVVVPLIEKIKIKEEAKTTLFLESGLSDVLSIVLTLGLIASLEAGVFHIDSVVFNIIIMSVMAVIIGGISALFWSFFLNKVHNVHNSAFATPAFVFIVYGITELLGYSGLVSIIVFGIILGNIPTLVSAAKEKHTFLYAMFHPQPLSSRELSFFCEIVFLIKIFFFIFIGISLNFNDLSLILLGLLLALFIFTIRIPAILLSLPKSTPKFDASIITVTLPRGLAAGVLALIPLQRGLENGQIVQDIAYAVIFFSVLLTSLLIFLIYNTKIRKLYEHLFHEFAENPKEGSPEYPKKPDL